MTSLEKLPSPLGRAGGGGRGWYHPAPRKAAAKGLALPYSWTASCFPLTPSRAGLPFPLLLLAFLPPLVRTPLLYPRTVTDLSEVTLKPLSVTPRAENSLCSLESSRGNVGVGRETTAFRSKLLKTGSL